MDGLYVCESLQTMVPVLSTTAVPYSTVLIIFLKITGVIFVDARTFYARTSYVLRSPLTYLTKQS